MRPRDTIVMCLFAGLYTALLVFICVCVFCCWFVCVHVHNKLLGTELQKIKYDSANFACVCVENITVYCTITLLGVIFAHAIAAHNSHTLSNGAGAGPCIEVHTR